MERQENKSAVPQEERSLSEATVADPKGKAFPNAGGWDGSLCCDDF